eukprot:Lankesteria_metandrocarpae@DN5487_c0_g1_i7.p1
MNANMLWSILASLVLIGVQDANSSACCGDARIYVGEYIGGQMRSAYDSRLLVATSDEERLVEKLFEVEEAVALYVQSEFDSAGRGSYQHTSVAEPGLKDGGSKEAVSIGLKAAVSQDATCLSERAKLTDWDYHPTTGSFWAVQDEFNEQEFTRFVVDILSVGELEYWSTGSGVVSKMQRVVVLRVGAAPNFLPAWESSSVSMPTVVCEESDLALNVLKEALKDYSGWFVLLVPSSHKSTWDGWLARHFSDLGGAACNNACLV